LGFEAKDYLRKTVIGKNVKVQIEYVRNIPVSPGSLETREMIFANVFLEKEMVQAKMLAKGFAYIQEERNEVSIYLKTLKEAE
jgi:endonuclease YncB( thermonuclease family)